MSDSSHEELTHEFIEREALIERYHRGDLDPETEERFEEHFFACSECQSALEAARGLRVGLRTNAAEEVVRASVAAGLFAWLARRSAAAQSSFLIAFFLLAATPSIWLWQRGSPVDPAFVEPSLHLLHAVRGDDDFLEIRADEGPIQLAVDADPGFASYQLRLETEQGEEILVRRDLHPNALEVLMITLPADFLAPGKYLLIIEGVSGGDREELARHRFLLVD